MGPLHSGNEKRKKAFFTLKRREGKSNLYQTQRLKSKIQEKPTMKPNPLDSSVKSLNQIVMKKNAKKARSAREWKKK